MKLTGRNPDRGSDLSTIIIGYRSWLNRDTHGIRNILTDENIQPENSGFITGNILGSKPANILI